MNQIEKDNKNLDETLKNNKPSDINGNQMAIITPNEWINFRSECLIDNNNDENKPWIIKFYFIF